MKTRVFIVTGGAGSGKSTFASKLNGMVVSHGEFIRTGLALKHPHIDWWAKEGKSEPRADLNGLSMRQVMAQMSEEIRSSDALAFFHLNRYRINKMGESLFVVDDLRRMDELKAYKSEFDVTHFHMLGGVPEYDCEEMGKIAEYRVNLGVEV